MTDRTLPLPPGEQDPTPGPTEPLYEAHPMTRAIPAELGCPDDEPTQLLDTEAAPHSPPPDPNQPGDAYVAMATRPEPATVPDRRDLGRILRRFAGVDEQLLAWVPQERGRYTGMGGAVLFTAVMAFLSMTVALSLAFSTRSPLLLIPALVWFVLILNFDRWLVSAPMANSFWGRLPTIVVRMGMAFLFGVVIAEPLVLAVFNTAVETQVLQSRADDLKNYESKWERCNPIDLTSPSSAPSATGVASTPACADFVVPLPEGVRALKNDFTTKQRQLTTLQNTLKPLIAQHDKLVKKSQDECLGKPGVGQTGRYGNGPVCKRLTQDAVNYANLNRIDALERNVVSLTDDLNSLSTRIANESTKWADQRSAYIAARVQERKDSARDIGLLERIEALNTLAVQHGALASAIWAVRALFILVDLAPALLKLTSGTTRYDRVVEAQLRLGELQFNAITQAAMSRAKRWSEDDRAALDLERARLAGERSAEYDRVMDDLERHWATTAEAAAPPERIGATGRRGWPMSGARYTYDPETSDRDGF